MFADYLLGQYSVITLRFIYIRDKETPKGVSIKGDEKQKKYCELVALKALFVGCWRKGILSHRQ